MNFGFNSYFEYVNGIKMWVRVFSVFVCGLKLARVDNTLGGELSIQNKTLSAFISWYCDLEISFLVIELCELTLSIHTILRETLFIYSFYFLQQHIFYDLVDLEIITYWRKSEFRVDSIGDDPKWDFCFCCQFEGTLS